AMDKTMTKRLWANEGLPTPQYLALSRTELTRERIRTIPDELGLPVVVKPPHEGSSIGITKAAGYSETHCAVALAPGWDVELLFDPCIEGPGLTGAVVGEGEQAVALPLIEIRAEAGNYDFANKYETDTTQYLFGSLPAALEAEIGRLVLHAYRLL